MDKWKIKNKEEGYSVSFSNDLIEKSLGQYSRLIKKMRETDELAEMWVLQTDFEVDHPAGSFVFTTNMYHDGKVVIFDTKCNRMHGHNINDVIFLRKAIMWLGWKELTATPSEIDSSVDFWKKCWETGLIESCYLDRKFKKRI
jgi:hypothetical protein